LRTVLAGLGAADARIKSNPAQVKRVVRATLRGVDFARYPAHQDKVIPFIMEDFQLDRKTAEASLREIVKTFFPRTAPPPMTPCAAISILFANETN